MWPPAPGKAPFKRLVRFFPKGSPAWDETCVRLGEPVDPDIDVGRALFEGKEVLVNIYSGWDILDGPGSPTGEQEAIGQLLSPLTQEQCGTIRCIGLNYISHAKEVGMEIPTVPTLFMKPETALAGPWPEKTKVPKSFVQDDAADYEAEVAIILDYDCKNVSEEDAMRYCYGDAIQDWSKVQIEARLNGEVVQKSDLR
ncbi:hypothetical protein NDA16_003688 [Ustilago loliicola]|nr:hypothetical protein NDA16_003688 [Ustilago loliicola]